MTEQSKPIIKSIEEKLPFDPFKILGLRPKKIDEQSKKYAGLNIRMIASTIDSIIAAVTVAPIVDYFMDSFHLSRPVTLEEYSAAMADEQKVISNLLKLLIESGKVSEFFITTTVQSLALIAAFAICWKIWSSTPGKMLLKMKIVDAVTGLPITNRQIIIRSLGYIVSGAVFFMGIFWIGLDKRKQGWHDKMANTVVIFNKKDGS